MRAAVLEEYGASLVLRDRADPEAHGDEVVVRVRGVGVCHSDLHIVDEGERRLPLVLGHEIAGEHDELGEVLVYGAWGCGSCRFCSAGEEQLCADGESPGFDRDGGYAEAVLVPSRRHLIPLEGLDPVRAAPLADAGVTPYRAVRRIAPRLDPDSTVMVIGAGGLGQFALQYVKLLTPASVVAVEISERKRQLALELGADEALSPDEVEQPMRAALDFVGSDETLALAARWVERAGAILLVGAARGQLRFGFTDVAFEVELGTSIWGSRSELESVLELARGGELVWHVEPLPLERANEALDRLRRGDAAGRFVLTP